MSGVILVRHAMPDVQQGVSSKLWGLSDSSREDCVLLAHALPAGIRAIWSSGERKARETAEVIGLRLGILVHIDERFGEVDRPGVWDRDYREVAAAYLGGVVEPGWEPRERVIERFSDAVNERTSEVDGEVLIVSHGLAMSLWAASQADIDLVNWWRDLTLPDAWRFDVAARTVEHVWLGGLRGD